MSATPEKRLAQAKVWLMIIDALDPNMKQIEYFHGDVDEYDGYRHARGHIELMTNEWRMWCESAGMDAHITKRAVLGGELRREVAIRMLRRLTPP